MTPVCQTVIHKKGGNCFAACVAPILELSIEAVPGFALEGDRWWDAFCAFTATYECTPLMFKYEAVLAGASMLGASPTPATTSW